jgi:L-amino acid N-acyltransferase YncA
MQRPDLSMALRNDQLLLQRPLPKAPGPMSLRNATTADAGDVLAIWNDGLDADMSRDGVHDFALGQNQVLEWIGNHQQALRPLWIASVDGQPGAVLSFIGFHERPWCQSASELSIHVRHGLRGRGIGRLLLQRAIAAAPALRFDRYVACIRSDSAASQALFRGCGFSRWGCLPGVMKSRSRRFDLLMYGLAIPAQG